MDHIKIRLSRQTIRELIDEAAKGGEVTLVRRGAPAAEPKRLPSLAAFRATLLVKGRPASEEIIDARG